MNSQLFLGPSGAVSYAVGVVAPGFQLQVRNLGFRLETGGFHPAEGFYSVFGFHLPARGSAILRIIRSRISVLHVIKPGAL
jgi:hypothetical protein